METVPRPDVVTCVSMLIKGVSEDALEDWINAQARVSMNVAYWQGVAGVNALVWWTLGCLEC